MQQINLYLPEFRPNREPLRAIHMAWASLAFFILLILFSVFSNFQNKKLEQQLVQAQQDQQNLQNQMVKISAQKPAQSSAELEAKIEKLQHSLQRHVQILAMISHQDLGNDRGFSAQLNALAQASMDTISLESFSLQKGGSYAELGGKTRSADQIPLYLQKLRKDPSFANVGFGVLNVVRNPDAGVLQFSLAKANDEKAKGEKH